MSQWIAVNERFPDPSRWVLAWLYLPKNPPASGHAIAQYTACKKDEPESFGRLRMTVDCWWANGLYYPRGHVTHWMPLPAPPVPNPVPDIPKKEIER